ncbi:MAG: hypothetical protein JXA54_12150 [Candidatus Heimdallarchaeota archaeon]|nr:hypothetical protein [Candidatus Heimdallarchaeota archaeon]
MVQIKNFWILSTSGIPLFLLTEKDTEENLLIGGFFSALQILIDKIEQSPFNKIELENRTYFYYFKEPIISVIEAEITTELESQVCQIFSQKLAKAFIDMYPINEQIEISVDISSYGKFREQYEKITMQIDSELQKSHKDFLSKYFIEAAKDQNVLGTVIYDLEKDEVISSDIPPDCAVNDFESFGSMLFSFLERLGKELKTGKINEVLIRGQKYWLGGFRKGSLAVFMLFDLNYFGKVLPDFVNAPLANFEQKR